MHGRDRPQRFKFRAWRATHHRQTEKKEVPKEHSTPQSENYQENKWRRFAECQIEISFRRAAVVKHGNSRRRDRGEKLRIKSSLRRIPSRKSYVKIGYFWRYTGFSSMATTSSVNTELQL